MEHNIYAWGLRFVSFLVQAYFQMLYVFIVNLEEVP